VSGRRVTVEVSDLEVLALRRRGRDRTGAATADDGPEPASGSVVDLVALLDRIAAALDAAGQPSPRLVLEAFCGECDGDVDLSTRRHVAGAEAACALETVHDDDLHVDLCCPVCAGRNVAEVNVGEVWDEVSAVSFAAGVLTVTVNQRDGMDREGDGWVCRGCATRVDLPDGYLIGFEYE